MGFFDTLSSFFASEAYAENEGMSEAEGDPHARGPPNDVPVKKKDADAVDARPKDQGADGKSGNSEDEGDEKDEGEEAGKGSEDDAKEDDGGEGAEEGNDDEEDEDEEEEEEEEEPEDPMPKLQAECAKTAACRPHVHEYEECVARVTAAAEQEGPHHGKGEDCVEEFFELTHCVSQCAAPKLFKILK